MSNIRIVALDLDGTLLNHKNEVSPATRQAIAEAVEQGVVVLPATGRALANLPAEVAQLPGILKVTCMNIDEPEENAEE